MIPLMICDKKFLQILNREMEVAITEKEKRFAELSSEETQELVQMESEFKERLKKRVILIAYEE